MNRSDLVRAVAEENPSLPIEQVENLVSAFFELITTRVVNGGRVEIRGFGVFETRDREARVGRNPRTGATVNVDAKRLIHFKPGKELRRRVEVSV